MASIATKIVLVKMMPVVRQLMERVSVDLDGLEKSARNEPVWIVCGEKIAKKYICLMNYLLIII